MSGRIQARRPVRRVAVLAAGALLATVLTVVATTAVGVAPADALTAAEASIGVGDDFSCALTAAHGVRCWGLGTNGRLGRGSNTSSSVPVDVVGLTSGVAQVKVGALFACALTTDGAVRCWGRNSSGQLGNGTTTDSNVPVPVTGLATDVISLDVGHSHACAVVAPDSPVCWGLNASHQAGEPSTANRLVPGPVDGYATGITAITAGTNHSCGTLTAGGMACWGNNTYGQLGTGAAGGAPSVPVAATVLPSDAATVDAGGDRTCAITTAGAMWCWGLSNRGQLGDGTTGNLQGSVTPVNPTGLTSGVASMAVGPSGSCAVLTSGAVRCWGTNSDGEVGTETVLPVTRPIDVPGLSSGVAEVAIAFEHSCALLTDGQVRCWGRDVEGELGSAGARSDFTPGDGAGITAMASGSHHHCVLTGVGGVRCWGRAGNGQLGSGSTAANSNGLALDVVGLTTGVAQVSAGGQSTCAVTTAGGAKCWGYNANRQLGNGSTTNSAVPVNVTGLTSGAAAISMGYRHACAVTTAGQVRCWGSNAFGQLGNGTTTNASTPVVVTGITDAVSVSAGYAHTCALRSTGGVTCWGTNPNGQLGDGTTTASLVPVDVVGLSDVTAIAVSRSERPASPPTGLPGDATEYGHTCALTSAGAVWCWGSGLIGQLGDGAKADSAVPVAVSGLGSGAVQIAVGSLHSCARTSAGAAVCWGANPFTSDSQGSAVPYALPQWSSGVTALTSGGDVEPAVFLFGAALTGTQNSGTACVVVDGEAVRCEGSSQFTQRGATADPVAVVGGPIFSGGTVPVPTIVGQRAPAPNAAGWSNSPVTVSFSCDGLAITECTSPVVLATDGAGQSASGTVSDQAGQSASTTVGGISIDQVPPTLAGLATTAPNASGWYRTPVTMAWTCGDDRSGIAGGACPAAATTSGEGSSVTVSASVSDRAGNLTSASSEAVQVDLTAPSTGVSSPPTWSRTDVTLALSATDALSGVASTSYRIDDGAVQSGTAPLVTGQGTHTVQYWSTDVAGNVEAPASVTVRIDTDAPSIAGSRTPAPNASGWNNSDVTVSFACGDTGSGVASCTGPASFSGNVDTTVTGTATDGAGNTASDQVLVRIDVSPPTVTAEVPPANARGWFDGPVQVPFSCVDTGGSGVASCPAPVVFAGEGADQPVAQTGYDNAGNAGTSSGATVSIDTTAPTISGAVVEAANPGGGYTGAVTVHWTCDDAVSGVVACPADQVVTGEGVHVVPGAVVDRAGNAASAEVTLTIDDDGISAPGVVRGTITDQATGQPVAGALVRLWNPAASVVVYSATTGTDGTYLFPIVDDGSYRLSVTRWGTHLAAWYPSQPTSAGSQLIVVAHDTDRVVDQALTSGYVLAGTVTSSAGGAPVGGATVRLSNGLSTVTDATGRYEFKGQAGGTLTVSFIAVGFAPATASATLPGVATLDRALVPSGASSGLKGTVIATTTVTGPLGPVAGATVRVWLKDASTYSLTVSTNAQGRFWLPDLPVGAYQVDVLRGGSRRWSPSSLSRTGATTYTLTAACTSTPDLAWGDPCATPVATTM